MIEASKAAELSSQPKKRGRKAWLIALAVVAAVVTIALLATPPKPEPVKVWFARATNEAGVKKLVFEGTNGMSRQIGLLTCVVTGAVLQANSLPGLPSRYDYIYSEIAPGTNFRLTLYAAPKDLPFCVMWELHDFARPWTALRRLRVEYSDLFMWHGMPRLAKLLNRQPEVHYIPSTEIKE